MERMTDYKPQERQDLEELYRKQNVRINELEEENKKLKKECEENDYLVEDNARWIKECGEKTKEIKKLKERINTMQEFIDYSEGVVQNAIGMLYEEGGEDKALDYLENCYATGDDKQYEEMERLYKDV